MINLTQTQRTDISELVATSIRAFHSDAGCGAPSAAGGPPGYDDEAWHVSMMQQSFRMLTLRSDDSIIGGAIVFRGDRTGELNLGRIWIDPDHQGKGLGKAAMQALFTAFPEADVWNLDTPAWNTRTRAFYPACGFSLQRESDGELFFIRKTSRG